MEKADKLCIACIEGSLSFRFLRWRGSISKTVKKLMKRRIRTKVEMKVVRGFPLDVAIFPKRIRKLTDWIRKEAFSQGTESKTLLLVGKSAGAMNLISWAESDEGRSTLARFAKTVLIVVDANHGPKLENRNDDVIQLDLNVACMNDVINLYTNDSRLGGYGTIEYLDNAGSRADVLNQLVEDETHFSIVKSGAVKKTIGAMLHFASYTDKGFVDE